MDAAFVAAVSLYLGLAVLFVGLMLILIRVVRQLRSIKKAPVSGLPSTIPALDDAKLKLLDLYVKEWQATIEVQTHFNDLIMRFRTSVLTVFVTAIGAVVTLARLSSGLHKSDVIFLAALPMILWFTSFVIDYFYYHRMLLGAVAHSLKFDAMSNENHGLFGLTTAISNSVKPPTSRLLIVIYYFIPVFFVVLLFVVLYGESFYHLPD